MEKIVWTVSDGTVKRKIQYTAKQRISKDMDDSQKAGAERWNDMVDLLQENGLMEEPRKGG